MKQYYCASCDFITDKYTGKSRDLVAHKNETGHTSFYPLKQIDIVCFHCGETTKHNIRPNDPTIADCRHCGATTESIHGAFGETDL
jgi:hypothetical protein